MRKNVFKGFIHKQILYKNVNIKYFQGVFHKMYNPKKIKKKTVIKNTAYDWMQLLFLSKAK